MCHYKGLALSPFFRLIIGNVCFLDDLSFNFLPFGAKNDIETLEDSSLFFNYLCYKKTKRVPTKVKGLFRKEKDFIVLDMDK